jgi:formylglycine-generating enzyme required for sulfatase activity
MGTPLPEKHPEYHPDEVPRPVHVSDFYLGTVPVTAAEYCKFLNINRRTTFGDYPSHRGQGHRSIANIDGEYVAHEGNHPAFPVTCKGARAYCHWLAWLTGHSFRLPSEAEWEYAARGSELREWPWGDTPPLSPATRMTAKYRALPDDQLRGDRWRWRPYPQRFPPVGSFSLGRTPDGVLDMLGYFPGEWCTSDPLRRVVPKFSYGPPQGYCIRGFYKRELERARINWSPVMLLFGGDARVDTHHSSRSWTRGSTFSTALLRVALDAR